jgi:hypothetical protein
MNTESSIKGTVISRSMGMGMGVGKGTGKIKIGISSGFLIVG